MHDRNIYCLVHVDWDHLSQVVCYDYVPGVIVLNISRLSDQAEHRLFHDPTSLMSSKGVLFSG